MRGGKIRKCLQTGLPKSGAPFFSSPKVNTVKKLLPSVLSAAVLGLAMLAPVGAADLRIGVVNMERTNFRYVTHNEIPEDIDFASVDVSFISLRIILPVLRELLKSDGQAVCLIKPQFEAGREKIGKKGVVRDPQVHVEVVENIVNFALENGFDVKNLDFSPIKGPEGNIEYLIHLRKSDDPKSYTEITPEELVKNPHSQLDK